MLGTPQLPIHTGITTEELLYSADCPGVSWPDLYEHGLILARDTRAWAQGSFEYIFGAGNPDARILAVGEGPGTEEIKSLIPFVGPAGQTLSGVLSKAGISRAEDVFLTNTVTLAPPGYGGRIGKPLPQDMLTEWPRILGIYEKLQPKIIVLLGAYAYADFFLQDRLKSLATAQATFPDRLVNMGQNLGLHTLNGFNCPIMVTYHPSYLLRRFSTTREPMEDPSLVRLMGNYLETFEKVKEICK